MIYERLSEENDPVQLGKPFEELTFSPVFLFPNPTHPSIALYCYWKIIHFYCYGGIECIKHTHTTHISPGIGNVKPGSKIQILVQKTCGLKPRNSKVELCILNIQIFNISQFSQLLLTIDKPDSKSQVVQSQVQAQRERGIWTLGKEKDESNMFKENIIKLMF